MSRTKADPEQIEVCPRCLSLDIGTEGLMHTCNDCGKQWGVTIARK